MIINWNKFANETPAWIWAFALVSTLFTYKYGASDQLEQLPIIMRAMDGTYLSQDFFVNASEGFGPRYYYAEFIGFFGKGLGLPISIFFLTLVSNMALGWVSFKAGNSLFPNAAHIGVFSAGLVLGTPVFEMGSDLTIYGNYLTPGLLISPLILAAIWQAWEKKYLLAGFLCGLASLFHVLYGIETGVLVLGASFLLNLIRRDSKALIRIVGAGAIMGLFALATLIPYLQLEKSLADSEFIDIIAYFRHPHHYVPSFIVFRHSNILFAFVSIFIFAHAFQGHKRKLSHLLDLRKWMLCFLVLLSLAVFAGWLMVEVFPSRLFVTAQLWRLWNLYKWIFLLFTAGSLALKIQNSSAVEKFILSLSYVHLIPMILSFFQRFTVGSTYDRSWMQLFSGILLLGFYLIMWIISDMPVTVLLLAMVMLFWLFLIVQYPLLARIYFGALLIFTGFQVSFLPKLLPEVLSTHSNKVLNPQIFRPPYKEELLKLGEFSRENLPEQAVILTPPGFGGLRIIGKRALVADFKAFPFGDSAILGWHNRIIDVYGSFSAFECTTMDELKEKQTVFYKKLNADHFKILQKKYHFDFALVDTGTLVNQPEIFRIGQWKLVSFQGNENPN